MAETSAVAKGFQKQSKQSEEREAHELAVKINIAYFIVKEELSFTKMKPSMRLQKKNGLDVTPTYA